MNFNDEIRHVIFPVVNVAHDLRYANRDVQKCTFAIYDANDAMTNAIARLMEGMVLRKRSVPPLVVAGQARVRSGNQALGIGGRGLRTKRRPRSSMVDASAPEAAECSLAY